jgi:hypothetical protein
MFLKCRALTMTDFVDDTELEEEVSDAVVPHASHATTPRDAPSLCAIRGGRHIRVVASFLSGLSTP